MTSQEMVGAVVADAMVIAAHTKQRPDGTVAPPNPGELQNMAQFYLAVTLGLILLRPLVSRRLLERSGTLTTTAGIAEYTLPTTISRVLNMRKGSDNKPIRFFESRDEHDAWYYRHYADSVIDDSDDLQRAYVSGRGTENAIKVTFTPGIGSETTIPYRYIRKLPGPYSVEQFPEEIHPAIFLVFLNRMSGGIIQDEAELSMQDAEHLLRTVITASTQLAYDEDVQECVDNINSHYV